MLLKVGHFNKTKTLTLPTQDRRTSDLSVKSTTSSRTRLPKAFLAAMKGNLYEPVQNRGPEEPTVPGNVR